MNKDTRGYRDQGSLQTKKEREDPKRFTLKQSSFLTNDGSTAMQSTQPHNAVGLRTLGEHVARHAKHTQSLALPSSGVDEDPSRSTALLNKNSTSLGSQLEDPSRLQRSQFSSIYESNISLVRSSKLEKSEHHTYMKIETDNTKKLTLPPYHHRTSSLQPLGTK